MATDMGIVMAININMGNINNRNETKFGQIYPIYK